VVVKQNAFNFCSCRAFSCEFDQYWLSIKVQYVLLIDSQVFATPSVKKMLLIAETSEVAQRAFIKHGQIGKNAKLKYVQ
jgi:hypothetical protein